MIVVLSILVVILLSYLYYLTIQDELYIQDE